jgi:hypothetical protein
MTVNGLGFAGVPPQGSPLVAAQNENLRLENE